MPSAQAEPWIEEWKRRFIPGLGDATFESGASETSLIFGRSGQMYVTESCSVFGNYWSLRLGAAEAKEVFDAWIELGPLGDSLSAETGQFSPRLNSTEPTRFGALLDTKLEIEELETDYSYLAQMAATKWDKPIHIPPSMREFFSRLSELPSQPEV